MITLQGAIEKSPILLSQYRKNEWLNGNKTISHFDGSNNIFADYKVCRQNLLILDEMVDNRTRYKRRVIKIFKYRKKKFS